MIISFLSSALFIHLQKLFTSYILPWTSPHNYTISSKSEGSQPIQSFADSDDFSNFLVEDNTPNFPHSNKLWSYLHHLFIDTLEHCHLKQSWSTIIASLFLQQQIAMHHVYLLKPFRIKIMCHWVAFQRLPLPQVPGMSGKKKIPIWFILLMA